jgi:hypothetical protein
LIWLKQVVQQTGQFVKQKTALSDGFWFALWHLFGINEYRGGMPQRWVDNYYFP